MDQNNFRPFNFEYQMIKIFFDIIREMVLMSEIIIID
jgi:hypothetical protein